MAAQRGVGHESRHEPRQLTPHPAVRPLIVDAGPPACLPACPPAIQRSMPACLPTCHSTTGACRPACPPGHPLTLPPAIQLLMPA
eukprot:363280-Chlamydomonas_euryale.AAC.5